MCLKTCKWKKVTYSLICVFVFFCTREENKIRKKKIEKREKSPQGNVRKEDQTKQKSPQKIICGGPTKLVKVLTSIRTRPSLMGPLEN